MKVFCCLSEQHQSTLLKSFEVKYLLRRGIKVGLGTDVAGGYSPSILSAMRAAVMASKSLQFRCSDFTVKKVFYYTFVANRMLGLHCFGSPKFGAGAPLHHPFKMFLRNFQSLFFISCFGLRLQA